MAQAPHNSSRGGSDDLNDINAFMVIAIMASATSLHAGNSHQGD